MMLNLGIDPSTKRDLVIDENGLWIDTSPLKISNSEVIRSEKTKSQNPVDEPVTQQVTAQLESSFNPVALTSLPTVESHIEMESDRPDVAISEFPRYKKLEEELRIERSARKHLEEELRTERSAREALEERLEARAQPLERKASLIDNDNDEEDALISDDQKWALSVEREKQRVRDYNERAKKADEAAKEEAERTQRELDAFLSTPEVIAQNMKALRDLREAYLKNGLASSPQDNPQAPQAPNEEDSSKTIPQPSSRPSSGPTAFDPDKGLRPQLRPRMKPSEQNNGKKDRNCWRWDHPSARDPPW